MKKLKPITKYINQFPWKEVLIGEACQYIFTGCIILAFSDKFVPSAFSYLNSLSLNEASVIAKLAGRGFIVVGLLIVGILLIGMTHRKVLGKSPKHHRR